MKLKEDVKNRDILSNVSVFMAFLAFSYLSFMLLRACIVQRACIINTTVLQFAV